MWNALLQECSSGTLDFAAPDVLRNIGGEFYTVHTVHGDIRPVPHDMLQHMHRLSFATVGEWLRDTRRVPSVHIAAWFAACGFVAPGGRPGELEAASQKQGNSTRGTRDGPLTPVFVAAVVECGSHKVASVMIKLQEFAARKRYPGLLISVTEDEVLYMANGEACALTRKNLSDRLRTLKNRDTPP